MDHHEVTRCIWIDDDHRFVDGARALKRCRSKYDDEQELRQGESNYIERMIYWGLGVFCVVIGLIFFVAGLEGGTEAPLAWLKEMFQ